MAVLSLVLAFVFFLGSRIVHFYTGSGFHGTEDFVAAGNDLATFLEAAYYFDVGGSGDAGLHQHKFSFAVADYEYTLDLFFVFGLVLGSRSLHRAFFVFLGFKVGVGADGQRLDWHAQRIASGSSGDLGGGGETRAKILRWIL